MKNYNTWYLDCGATEHMTPYLNKIKNFKKTFLRAPMAIKEEIQAEGKGDIILKFCDKNGGLLADLADVLFVPNLGANLLSVGRLVEKDLKITFEKNEAKILKVTGEVLLTAFRKNRLYEVQEETQNIKLKNIGLTIWQQRFGHFENDSEKLMLKEKPFRNFKKEDDDSISVSTLGLMKCSPFRNSFRVSTTKPLELIHSDVVGIIEPTSQGGSKYFVSFIDDYSRYTAVFPIKSNSEVLLKFDEYRRLSENALGMNIQAIRTGNEGEYISKEFEDYLQHHCIMRKHMISGIPQRNSVAKNMNQKLLNMTKHLMKESGIPGNLWADALVTACYVINKCPSIAIQGKIPEELWTGKKVHTEHLRVFGCRAWITLNPGETFGTADCEAIECIFIGYTDDMNSYKLWERKRNVFFITEDVNFDENNFPCKREKKSEETSSNKQKLNIVTIRVENEDEEGSKSSLNTDQDKTVLQTEETVYGHEEITDNLMRAEIDFDYANEEGYGSEVEIDRRQYEGEGESSTTEEIVLRNT